MSQTFLSEDQLKEHYISYHSVDKNIYLPKNILTQREKLNKEIFRVVVLRM